MEDTLGRRLLDRTPRLVRLSADGNAFLGPARALIAAHHGAIGCFDVEQQRLVVGISHHLVGAEATALVATDAERRTAARARDPRLDFGRCSGSVRPRRHRCSRDPAPRQPPPRGETILEETFSWMASPDFEHHDGEPLRLATQADPCSVRSMAVDCTEQGRNRMDRSVRWRRDRNHRRSGLGRPCGRRTWPPSGPAGNNRRGSATRLAAAAFAGSGASREPQGSGGQKFAEDACCGDPSHGSTAVAAQGGRPYHVAM